MEARHQFCFASALAAAYAIASAPAAIQYQTHSLSVNCNATTRPPDSHGFFESTDIVGIWNWSDSVSVQHLYPGSAAPATAFSKGSVASNANAAFLHVYMDGMIQNNPLGGPATSDVSLSAFEHFTLTTDTPFSASIWGDDQVMSLAIQRLDVGPPVFIAFLSGYQSFAGVLEPGEYSILAMGTMSRSVQTGPLFAGFEYAIPAPSCTAALAIGWFVRIRRRREGLQVQRRRLGFRDLQGCSHPLRKAEGRTQVTRPLA